jgi:hypothetical protein
MEERDRADELGESIQQLHALEMAVRLQRSAQIAEFDRDEAWQGDGATSMAAWLVAACGLSRHSANVEVAVARALPVLPAIAKAAGEGLLSWDQLVAVIDIATPDTDADLASEAPGWTADQLRALARSARRRRRDTRADRPRGLRYGHDQRRGGWDISGHFDDDEGAVIGLVLDRLADKHNTADTDGNYEPIESRCADALVELASTQLAEDGDADRACIVIHTDIDGFFDDHSDAELQDGPSITADTLRRLACDSRWQLVVDHRDGTPAGIGRTSRQIPAWMSRALRRRDRHCRFPGCDRTRWTQGHHIHHWIDGGPTDLTNMATLCVRHHHLVHEDGWTLEGDPNDTLRFIKPNGKIITSRPTPLRSDIKTRFLGPDPPAG